MQAMLNTFLLNVVLSCQDIVTLVTARLVSLISYDSYYMFYLQYI